MKESTNYEPWLAVNYSLIFTGLGHIYIGRKVGGYILILLQISIAISSILLLLSEYLVGIFTIFIIPLVALVGAIDCYRKAKKNNTSKYEENRKENADPWIAVLLTKILPGIGHLYLKKYLMGLILLILYLLVLVVIAKYSFFVIILVSGIVSGLVMYLSYRASSVRGERSGKTILLVIALNIAISLLVGAFAMGVREYCLQAYYLPGGSMEDTMLVGDHIYVRKYSYQSLFSSAGSSNEKYIKRGDIVVYMADNETKKEYLHRCVAVGGDTFSIKDNRVFVNGVPLREPYAKGETSYRGYAKKNLEGVVPEGAIIVLGDNRENSFDSRGSGYIPADKVKGKAIVRYWYRDFIKKPDFSRLGKIE
jgi:signal peptidase I